MVYSDAMAANEGWEASAEAWIADMGERGDWGREQVLDPVMIARVKAGAYRRALDVGCGEGRFCRTLRGMGVAATGLDPTARLLEEARRRDPGGDYRSGVGEALPFPDASFDLVVSYLSLIDIEPYQAAIAEMARVLSPGGALLVANLTSLTTAAAEGGWERDASGEARYFKLDRYLEPRASWERWRGIAVRNHHRPLSAYLQAFLAQGLQLTCFDEPAPREDSAKARKYRRAPWYLVLEWRKPAAAGTP